jgi:hypothetical protein
MSVSTLLSPNSLNLYCATLNGQVPSGSNIPDTVGQPDGYVLAIANNLTGELEWKQDASGSIPDPLVLSGTNSVNKFQVRNDVSDPLFTVDTVDNQVFSTAIRTAVGGPDDEQKFGVYNSSDGTQGILEVSTQNTNQGVTVQGQNASHKFRVKENGGVEAFNVDTLNNCISEFKNQSNATKFRVETIDHKTLLTGATLGQPTRMVVENTAVGSNSLTLQANDGNISEINASDQLFIQGNIVNFGSTTDTRYASIKRQLETITINTVPPLPVPSNMNIKVDNDAGGAGSNTFIGFVARNGPNGVYNLVNNQTTGLFFVAPNAGLQCSDNMVIGAKASLTMESNLSTTVKGGDSVLLESGNNVISVYSSGPFGLVFTSTLPSRFQSGDVEFSYAPPTTLIAPTNPSHMTNKTYVDTLVGNLYAGTSFGPLISGTGVLSGSLLPATGVGSLTLPANTFQAGNSYHLVIAGQCNFSGGNTLTINLNSSSGNIGTVVATTELTNGSKPFEIEVDFSIHTIGGSGTLVTSFDFTYIGTNQGQFVGARSCSQHSIVTNISQTLSVSASFNAGTNTIRTYSMYLKRMN